MPDQFIQIPFAGGIDETTAVEYQDPSKRQANVVNGVFKHVGAIEKRRGMKFIPQTILPGNAITSGFSNPKRIVSTKASGLLAFTDKSLYNQSPEGLAGIGNVPNVKTTRTPMSTVPGSTSPRLCDFGTMRMAVNQSGDLLTMYISVVDTVDDAVVLQPFAVPLTLGGSGQVPGPVQVFLNPFKTHAIIVYQDNDLLKALFYDVVALTFSAPVVLNVGAIVVGSCDACPFVNDPLNQFIVVAVSASAVPTFQDVQYFAFDGVTGAQTFTTPIELTIHYVPRVYVMATYGATELIWITYGKSPGAGLWQYYVYTYLGDGSFALNHHFNVFSSATTQGEQTPFCYLDHNHAWMGFLRLASDANSLIDTNWGEQHRFDDTGGTNQVTAWPMGLYPQGRPVADGSGVDAPVVMPCGFYLLRSVDNSANDAQSLQPTMYLVRFTETYTDHGLPVATVAPRILNQAAIGGFTLLGIFPIPYMSCGHLGTTVLPARAAVGLNIQSSDHFPLISNQGAAYTADFFFEQSDIFETHELGDGVHVQSGVPFGFDGTSIAEEGFFFYPEFAWTTITHPATGTLLGKYSVAFIYRSTDAAGNEVKSAPFFSPQTTSLVHGDAITYHVPRLSMSWRHNKGGTPVYCDIYRTVGDGATYYLLTTIDVTPKVLPAVVTDLWATFGPDTTDDATIAVASTIYTTGNALDNVNPPAALCQTIYKNRLWILDETGTRIWFTQAYSPGLACGFNEVLTIDVNEGGAGTAIAALDDKLVIFKNDSIWIIFGDPPPVTGIGSSLTEPQQIATDVGALNWQSVVLTPHGLMFEAASGIHMLGRDLQVQYIGKPVQDTLATLGHITSADLVSQQQHVRFAVAGQKMVIVYDYFLNQWTTFQYDHIGTSVIDTTVIDGFYALVDANGALFREFAVGDSHAYLDMSDGSTYFFVPTIVTHPSIKTQGIQGYQRVRLVQYYGRIADSCGISMGIAINADPTIVQEADFTDVLLSANAFGDKLVVYLAGEHNICESIQTTLQDFAGDNVTNGQGAVFITVGYEIETLGQRNQRVPVTARQ